MRFPLAGPEASTYAFRYELTVPGVTDPNPEDNEGQILITVGPHVPDASFTSWAGSVFENVGFVELAVARSFVGSGAWPTVDFFTLDGTAVGGVHYTPVQSTIVFTNGQTLATIRIPILYDRNRSEDRTFHVCLGNTTGNLAVGATAVTTVTIRDVDAVLGRITPVSVLDTNLVPGGGLANFSDLPLLTENGRYVYFISRAVGLAPGITNWCGDNIYRRDLWNERTELVSGSGTWFYDVIGDTWLDSISPDGAYVAFSSTSSHRSPIATNGLEIAFLRDMAAQLAEIISVNTNGGASSGSGVQVSDNGRYVAFSSDATDLTATKFNSVWDVLLRDRLAGTTCLITKNAAGISPPDRSAACFSRGFRIINNRYLIFYSNCSDLVGEGNGFYNVYVHDIETGGTRLVSRNWAGTAAGAGDSYCRGVSADGRYVLLQSTASDLVSTDFNQGMDVFVRDTWNDTTSLVSANLIGYAANGESFVPSISRDGRYVLFNSNASDLAPVPAQPWPLRGVYRRDLVTGETKYLCHSADDARMSSDGRYVLLINALPLTPGRKWMPGSPCYVLDTSTGTFEMLTRTANGDQTDYSAIWPAFAGSASVIAFTTDAQLVPEDHEPAGVPQRASDVYVWQPEPPAGGVDLVVGSSAVTNFFGWDTNFDWQVIITNAGQLVADQICLRAWAPECSISAVSGSQGEADFADPAVWKLGSLHPGATATVLFHASNTTTVPLLSGQPEVQAYAAQTDLTPYNNRCSVYFQQSLPEGDLDCDGIPTRWELEYGLDPTHGADALADPDGDGVSNLHEYLAGTDPRHGNSPFRIGEVLVSGSNLVVRLPSVSGRFYGLERNRNLPWVSWERVTNGVPGTGGLIELVDPGFVDRHRNAVYRAIVAP